MTEEQESKKEETRPAPLAFDDVIDFFKSATAETCPMCGDDHWAVSVTAPDEEKYPIISFSRPEGKIGTRIPVVVAACMHCGFARMHIRKVITDWVQKGKPPLGLPKENNSSRQPESAENNNG